MEFTESQGNWDVPSRCPDLSGIVGVNMSFGQNGILKSVTPTCGAPFDLEQGRTAMLKVGFGEGLPSLGSIESTTCDQGLAVSSSPVGTEYYLPLAFKKGNRVTRNISDQEMAAIKTGVFEGIDYHHDILNVINADPRMEGDRYMMEHFKEEIKKAFENPQNPKIVFVTGARTHTSIHQLTIYVGEHRIGLKKIIRYVNGKQVPNTSTGCGFNYIVFSCLLVTLFGI
ncbi:Smr domain-containing protein [Caenorhabditis elegans]|uniref:Smr domain-containing protein n=1 Tax=Caenorhabditis elegans TaxID=6239 RepID=A0A0S4XR66_CAEEL|nr:Smr domain-containing protein [Caenorhabditis elegans]CUV67074.1 Smr domain-containing protein [Caenorhabditis elegans]|eukprot:NP_001305221.1 Uncharacterized protein CELE_F46F5.1 [Caenorhabditis elegans]